MASAPSPQKVIVRGAGLAALSFPLKFAARATLLFIGAKLYGPAIFGAFALAVATLELAHPLASLGLKRMVFPWLEDDAARRGPAHVLLDALLLSAASGALVAAAIVALAALAPAGLISEQLRLSLMLLAPALLGQIAADISLSVTRWTHRMRYEVIARGLVEPYVATGVALAAWLLGYRSVGLLVGYWAGTLVLVGFALLGARRCLGGLALRRWRPSLPMLRERLGRLRPATGSDIAASLADRLDFYLVGLILGDAPAGIYGVVRELRVSIQQVRQAFDSMLIPVVARTMRTEGDIATGEAIGAATRLILSVQLIVVLFLVAAGAPLLALFGPHYAAAYPVLMVQITAQMINSGLSLSELILYFRRPGLALAKNILTIAVSGLLIPVLTPILGLLGASLATLASAIVGSVVRRHWLRKMGVQYDMLHIAPPVAAALMGGAAGWLLHGLLLDALPDWTWLVALASAAIAIGSYGVAIRWWLRVRPGALSLMRFKVAPHGG